MLLFFEDKLKRAALEVQEYVRLVSAAFHASLTRPVYRYDIVEQFDAIGVQSLTVVLLTGFFTGAVLALQSGLTLDQFGARPVVGRLVSASMIKELGPVLTGLMLCGRVGSGIAAELGSMVVMRLLWPLASAMKNCSSVPCVFCIISTTLRMRSKMRLKGL